MRRACIDIGSNTTRLLVAECEGEQLREVRQIRAFTRIGQSLEPDGSIRPGKIDEVVSVVGEQLRVARELGSREVYGVATAAIRRAPNGAVLAREIRDACGLDVEILSGEDEARLAFVGVAATLGHVPDGELGVVDVGGGSSELVVGTPPDEITWSESFGLGSGRLVDRWLRADPPSAQQLAQARSEVATTLAGVWVPHPSEAVAVGGSATSLRRLAGPLLDAEAFARTLALLASEQAIEVARRFALDTERVRLLAGALLILQATSEIFGAALQIGKGGVREGVLLRAGA